MPVSFRYKNEKPYDQEISERKLSIVPPEIPEEEIKTPPEENQLFHENEQVETQKGLGRLLDFVKAHLGRKKKLNSVENKKNLKGVKAYQRVQNPEEDTQKGLQLKKAA